MPFVLLPGAWMGAWVWDMVGDKLRNLGHQVHALTLPGLEGEPRSAEVGLQDHVAYVLEYLETHDMRDVLVVGHSYSGLVAGQVAERAPSRVIHSVYVDAFLPHDGKSLLDAFPKSQSEDERRQIAENNGRWPAPDAEGVAEDPGLSAQSAQGLAQRFVDHPGRTVTDLVRLKKPLKTQRATFILSSDEIPDDVQAMCAEPTWRFRTLAVGHWPMVAAPDQLAVLLDEAASG
jgi:pimeloyl-ACP methyl ester carboxylesterase